MQSTDRAIIELNNYSPSQSIIKVSDKIEDRIQYLQDVNQGKIPPGIQTGFRSLDKITLGLHNKELTILAAYTSVGKTSFALNIVDHVAISENKPVLYFSLEMAAESLIYKLLCARAMVSWHDIRSKIALNSWDSLQQSAKRFQDGAPIFIDDNPCPTVQEIKSKCKQYKMQHDIGLVVLDLIQLISIPDLDRRNEVAKASQSMFQIARENDIPVLALSHLRRPEKGKAPRPSRYSLKESGDLENMTDNLWLLHREENDKGIRSEEAELIVAKTRLGPTGIVNLEFKGSWTRFTETADDMEDSWGSHES
jgi:replicative DNA helicase